MTNKFEVKYQAYAMTSDSSSYNQFIIKRYLGLDYPLLYHSYYCGYVTIDENHPLYGKDYTYDVIEGNSLESMIPVIGGITFSEPKLHVIEPFLLKHKKLWIFGFDTLSFNISCTNTISYYNESVHNNQLLRVIYECDKLLSCLINIKDIGLHQYAINFLKDNGDDEHRE